MHLNVHLHRDAHSDITLFRILKSYCKVHSKARASRVGFLTQIAQFAFLECIKNRDMGKDFARGSGKIRTLGAFVNPFSACHFPDPKRPPEGFPPMCFQMQPKTGISTLPKPLLRNFACNIYSSPGNNDENLFLAFAFCSCTILNSFKMVLYNSKAVKSDCAIERKLYNVAAYCIRSQHYLFLSNHNSSR